MIFLCSFCAANCVKMCCFILLSKNRGALPATTLDTFKAIIVLKIRKNRSKHHVSTGFLLAAEEGFEPSHTESESAVLPLHNSANYLVLCRTLLLLYPLSLICQAIFSIFFDLNPIRLFPVYFRKKC